MKEYAVEVELSYFDTVFVEAESKSEAITKVMDTHPFGDNYKVLAFGKEEEFANVEFVGIGEVEND